MTKLWFGCALLFNLSSMTSTAPADEAAADAAVVTKAVSKCVDIVRSKGDEWSKGFDAFYNPGTGQVEINVVYVGGREPLFRFKKCMVQQGFPLN
jgi:hypothetical protein